MSKHRMHNNDHRHNNTRILKLEDLCGLEAKLVGFCFGLMASGFGLNSWKLAS